jgi:predicted metal-binding membrane protein
MSAGHVAAAGPAPHAGGPFWQERGTVLTGAILLAVAAAAWAAVIQQAIAMGQMEMASPGGMGKISPADAAVFLGGWGVMMAAMMLPSALPMIALYCAISRNQARAGRQVVLVAMFAATYLAIWLLFGVPVYLASAAVGLFAGGASWLPYALAAVLAAAGVYQFTAIKQTCLKNCQTPFTFIMTRWRPGLAATLRLGLSHAAYCVGCCWGLMAVLVAAGAMSLPWVLLIAAIVFVEKLLPHGRWTVRIVGAALVLLAAAVVVRPDLAVALRGGTMMLEGEE